MMLAGLLLQSTKMLFATGYTLLSSGMLQSYCGSVFEIEAPKRGRYILIGIPLAIGLAYIVYSTLEDSLPDWYWISATILISLLLQVAISLIATNLWNRTHFSVSGLQNIESVDDP